MEQKNKLSLSHEQAQSRSSATLTGYGNYIVPFSHVAFLHGTIKQLTWGKQAKNVLAYGRNMDASKFSMRTPVIHTQSVDSYQICIFYFFDFAVRFHKSFRGCFVTIPVFEKSTSKEPRVDSLSRK